MIDRPREADSASHRSAARVRAALSAFRVVHKLSSDRIGELLGELPEVVDACERGELFPSRELQQKVKALSLRMSYALREAWIRRVGSSSGYEMLLDRALTIVAIDGMFVAHPRPKPVPPAMFLGRKYKDTLASLDCTLINTHGTGLDDLHSVGFFEGKVRCVRYCAEMNVGRFAKTGVREIHPVETVDDGILAHLVMHEVTDYPRMLTEPGIFVHWRELILT